MSFGNWSKLLAGWGLSALALASLAVAQRATNTPNTAGGQDRGDVERGRYLVEDVAMCGECHTPRNGKGDLKTDAWLQGATTWIRPVAAIQPWADTAPPLAGMPSFTDEQLATILEKGTGPEGEVLRPPMHIYHMHHEDAKAIIAYLKTLPAGSR
ncbi:MAG: cytochrome c [Candidatus Acidiferrum sp.]|jgi:mono/diheme cytochrome c family protein